MSRVLNWRRRITRMKDNGFRSWEVENKACESMLLEEGHICIINPLDEKPHYNEDVKEIIHFQHGNVKVSGNNISVGFVFRVSPHRCICNTHDNRVVMPESISKTILLKEKTAKVKQRHRTELYNSFNQDTYHKSLKTHFKSILKH